MRWLAVALFRPAVIVQLPATIDAVPKCEIVVLELSTYRDNSFSPNHASRGPFSSPYEGCLANISPTACLSAVLFAQNMMAQDHNLHIRIKTTLAWRNIAARA